MNKGFKNNSVAPSIHKISNVVIDEQVKDIRLFTQGHLNEAHLWKSPDQAHHISWESANKPHLLMRPAHKFNKTNVDERVVDKMVDDLADFTMGSTIGQMNKQTASSSNFKKDVYVEELKLPDIMLAKPPGSVSTKKSSQQRTPRPAEHLEKTLPKVNNYFSSNSYDTLPKSDMEIAFKIIHDPLSGATKQDKLKNLKKFEENVIHKSDVTQTNVLFDTKKAKKLEFKLENDLSKLNLHSTGFANFHRLQVYSSVLDDILLDKNIFGELLNDIKREYDAYLYYLLDEQSNNGGQQLRQQMQLAKASTFNKLNEINNCKKEIEELENLINQLEVDENNLKQKIEFEENFNQKKSEEEKFNTMNESSITVASISSKNAAMASDIAEKIEITKDNIIRKLKSLTDMNDMLNRDFVPNSVITNLTQSIKDTEVEIQKLIQQSEYLDDQVNETESELKNILLSYDNTEFAEENAEYLLKFLRNLDVLQLNSSNKTSEETKQQNSDDKIVEDTNEQTNTVDTEQRFYDDYFS